MSAMPAAPDQYATKPAITAAQSDSRVRQACCILFAPLHVATPLRWRCSSKHHSLRTLPTNSCCSRRQDSWLTQWLPYATIIAATSVALACCQSWELSAEGQAILYAATAMLLAGILTALLLLTHQTVESWVRQRILANTPPWEVVITEERTALASSDASRCVPLPGAQLACGASRLQVRMSHLK